MDRPTRKRKRETRDPDQDPATSACPPRRTGDRDQTQHLTGTKTNPASSVGTRDRFGHGKLPPISTYLKQLLLNQGVSVERSSSGGGGVGSDTVNSGPPSGDGVVPGRPDAQRAAAAGGPLRPDPLRLAATRSPSPGSAGDHSVINFTVPPTEEGRVSL